MSASRSSQKSLARRFTQRRRWFTRRRAFRKLLHEHLEDRHLLASVVTHYDASALSGLLNGDAVTQWDDISGNNNHALVDIGKSAGSFVANGIGGQPSVDFDLSANGYLSQFDMGTTFGLQGDADWSMTIVFRADDSPSGSNRWIAGLGVGNVVNGLARLEIENGTGSRLDIAGGFGQDVVLDPPGSFAPFIGQDLIVTYVHDGGGGSSMLSSFDLFVNGYAPGDGALAGTFLGTTGNAATTPLSLADAPILIGASSLPSMGSNGMNGLVAEVLVYDGALAESERQAIEFQLSQEYGVAGNFVSTNTAPEITSLSVDQAMIFENESVTLDGNFTDPDAGDEHTVTIDWGDGTVQVETLAIDARSFSFPHQYLDDGVSPGNGTSQDDYTISVTVSDDNGGSSAGSGGGALAFDPYFTLPTSPEGAGELTVGDFNEDGLPDVAVAHNIGSYPNNPGVFTVFLNTGGGQFGAGTTINPGGGAWTGAGITSADFNNDGHLDVVLTHGGSNSLSFGNKVSVSLGDGSGSFSPFTVFSTGGSLNVVTTGDFNEDNNTDLAIATPDGNSVSIHLGNGNGTFGGANPIGLGSRNAADIVVQDFNQDGHVDLAIPTPDTSQIRIYSGNGLGGFSAPTILSAGAASSGLAAGDFDEDGNLDLAATSSSAGDVRVFLGNGVGGFSGPTVFAVGANPGRVAAADVDNDGHLDLLTGSQSTGSLFVLTGDGSGSFATPISTTVGTYAGARVRATDFNADGRLDVAVTSGAPMGVSVLLNTTTGGPDTVGVTVKNVDPVGADQNYTTDEDVSLNVNVLAGADDSGPFTVTDQGTLDTHTAVAGTFPTAQGGSVTIATNGSATYTPTPDFFGTDSFAFTVEDDDTGSDIGNVTITIDAVNDEPTFTASNPPAVNEDAGAQTVNGWAVFDPGAANESGQSVLAYTVSNISAPLLFATLPSVDPSGNLTYTPAANANGMSTFKVQVQDDGGTANGGDDTSQPQTFTITVTPLNDAPEVSVPSTSAITDEDVPLTISGVTVSDIDAGTDPIAITLSIDNGSLSLTSTAGLTFSDSDGSDGTLAFTGSQSDINAALAASIVYTPSPNFNREVASLPPDLVSWLNADAVSGTTAFDIQGPNDGTLVNGATTTTDGQVGDAFEFDGVDDYLEFPTNGLSSSALTAVMWFKLNSWTDHENLLQHSTDGFNQNRISLERGNGHGGCPGDNMYLITGNTPNVLCTSTSFALDTWYFVATSLDSLGNTRIYVNGILENSATSAIVPSTLDSKIYVGRAFGDIPARVFDGLVDEVQVFNRVLDPAEVQSIYESVTVGPPTVTLTITANDQGSTGDGGPKQDSQQIAITVTPVNDEPTFAASNPPAVNEDAGAQTVSGWTTFYQGAANETGQSVLAYTVSNVSNPGLFTVAPSVDASGNLTYAPAADANGTSTFDLQVEDDGGTANGGDDTSQTQQFTITVNAVNDAPEITSLSVDQAMIFENESVTLTGNFTDPDAGDEHTVTIDWGDGTVQVETLAIDDRSFSFPHQYLDDGRSPGKGKPQDDYTIDVSVSDDGGGSYYGSGGGALAFDPYFTLPTSPEGAGELTVGDFNEDGLPDVAVAHNIGAYPNNPGVFTVFLNTGGGQFGAGTTINPGGGAWTGAGIASADFNNDGHLDVVLTHGGSNSLSFGNKVSVSLGDGSGSFSPFTVFSTGGSLNVVTTGDFNEDNNTDLAIATPDGNSVSIHLGNGNGTFGGANQIGLGSRNAGDIVVRDFNQDGHFDLAIPTPDTSQVRVFSGDGLGGFSTLTVLPAGAASGGLAAGDFDEDGNLDLAATSSSAGDVRVFLGNGGGGFSGPTVFAVGANPGRVAAADVDNDGHLDLLTGSQSTGSLFVLTGDGNGSFAAPTSLTVGTYAGARVRATDFNADGKLDVAVTSGAPKGVSLLLNTTTGGPDTVGVTVKNVDPVGADQNYTTDEDVSLNVNVLAGADDSGPFTVTDQGTLDIHTAVAGTFPTAQGGSVTIATNGSATYTPTPEFFGTDSFAFTVEDDDTGSDIGNVTITIDAVNDEPTFAASNPPAVNEDAGAQTINGWAAFDPGAAHESGQSVLAYTVSNISNPGLFAASPSVDASGNLTFTPAANANGTSTFKVQVQDSGGTANGGDDTSPTQQFTITVNAVNDAPEITSLTLDQAMIFENESVTLDGDFTDSDSGDEHTVTIDWGDGAIQVETLTVGDRTFSFPHQYLDDGDSPGNGTPQDDYAIQVTLDDGTGVVTLAWDMLEPTGPLIPGRVGSGTAYDPTTNTLIVHAGADNIGNCGTSCIFGDVWTLDNANGDDPGSPQWTELSPSGAAPFNRVSHGTAYDAANNRLIAFGGSSIIGYCGGVHNDTWVLADANGNGSPTWTQLNPTGSLPSNRRSMDVHYDADNNRMIMYGGSPNCGTPLNDTYVLENANGLGGTPNWTALSPAGTPPVVGDQVTAYDRVNNRLIVWASSNQLSILENANGLGGAPQWTQLAYTGTTPFRFGAAVGYDATKNELMLFGGSDAGGRRNETFLLEHANGIGGTPNWIRLSPDSDPVFGLPANRSAHEAFLDPTTGNFVIFAGTEFNFANGDDFNDVWVLRRGTSGEDTSSVPVTVKNVAPDFEAGLDVTLSVGSGAFSRAGMVFIDPGMLDEHDLTVNYGDGSGDQTTTLAVGDRDFDLSHTYTTSGTYLVEVTVEDDDTGSHTDSFEVTVTLALNQPPVAEANGPYSVPEGASVMLASAGSYDPDGSTANFEWDFDYDGATFDVNAIGTAPTFSAAGLDGPTMRTVALRVTDNLGATAIDTATIDVTNAAPTITAITDNGPVDEGSPVSVTISATDPAGALDPMTYWFDFDHDGVYEVSGGSNSAARIYGDNGNYTVGVRVTDGDGGVATSSTTVTVDNVVPTLDAGEDKLINEGQSITLDPARFSDLGFGISTTGTLDSSWIQQFGSSSADYVYAVATDGGGVYVAGDTEGTLPGQVSAGGQDAFVASLDTAGNVQWTRQFGTSFYDDARAVAVGGGGIYVAGFTASALPGQTYAGGYDAFVSRFDTAGNLLWTRQFGTSSFEYAFALAADDSGVYVAGRTNGTLPGQSSAGDYDAYVARFDTAGNLQWTRQFGSGSYDEAVGLASDGSGVYVAGNTGGTLSGQSSAGGFDAFVVHFDTAGNLQWARQFGSGANDFSQALAAGGTGIYAAGYTLGTLPGQNSLGDRDAFVVRLDMAGSLDWTRQFGTSAVDNAWGLTADINGVSVVGDTEGTLVGQTSVGGRDAILVRFDTAGILGTARQFGTNSAESAWGVAVDGTGVYVSGHTFGTLSGQSSAGGNDAFVVKFQGGVQKETFTAMVDWGDGTTEPATGITLTEIQGSEGVLTTGTIQAEHAFADDGIYTVTVRIWDDDMAGPGPGAAAGVDYVEDTFTVTVENVNPTITGGGNNAEDCGNVAAGDDVMISVNFRDPGFDDPAGGTVEDFTASTIDWGDGTVESVPDITVSETPGSPGVFTTGAVSGSHAYTDGGIYTITVTIIDDDGGSAQFVSTAFVTGVGLDASTGALYIIGTNGKDIVNVHLVGGSDGGSDGGHDHHRRGHNRHGSDGGSDGGQDQIKVIANLDVRRGRDRGSDGGSDAGADIFYFDPEDVQSIVILLCDGNDHATVGSGGSDGGSDGGADLQVPAFIDGGAGNDHLTGGGGDDTMLGGPGNDKLNGRGGDDALSGGDGKDKLKGGIGDDVLIGGDGKDNLQGGKGDDLLIAATWMYESSVDALHAIHAEWTRNDAAYKQKRDHLTGADSGGLNGAYILDDTTLTDDGDKDTLKGNQGRDLFFAKLGSNEDRVKDKKSNESSIEL